MTTKVEVAPAFIEVLLAFWYDPNARERDWSPGQVEFISRLESRGILTRHYDGRLGCNPDALKPYIIAVCAVPLPIQQWVIP